jgi:hypothetical protein
MKEQKLFHLFKNQALCAKIAFGIKYLCSCLIICGLRYYNNSKLITHNRTKCD